MWDLYCFQNVFVIVDKPQCVENVILFNFLLFQGEMLTVVEYFLLLYRALLPTPVWYCFFLNKEYGSLFSSLTTGLYLTFKLTSVVEKVLTLPSHHHHRDVHRHHVMVVIIFFITYLIFCYITGAIISNISESIVT